MLRTRNLYIVLIAMLVAGCAPLGWVSETTWDPVTGKRTTVRLSEYFESKNMIAGGNLQAHLIVTLGRERVPKGYKLEKKINRFASEIEEVTEIYFTNKSAQPVTISNMVLRAQVLKLDILPSTITVAPGKWVKSDPIVRTTSVYRHDIDSVLHYEYKGEKHEAALPQIRTPVSELKRKQTTNHE